MERSEHDIVTELVAIAGLSLDELLMCPSGELDRSMLRLLRQVDLPQPLVAANVGANC